MRLTRRKVLLSLITALGFDPSSLPGFGGRNGDVPAAAEAGETGPAHRTLSTSEADDLVAFVEVLVGVAPLPPAERQYIVDHLERHARQTGGYYRDLYRQTVGLLNRLAGARIATIDIARRTALVNRYRLAVADVESGERLGPSPADARAIRTRAVPDLIGAYYRSAAGWAVVGYGDFPGKCGDLTRYTRAES